MSSQSDLSKKALLLIDVQYEYLDGLLPVTYPPNSLDNIIKVARAAEMLPMHLIVVRHTSAHADMGIFTKGSRGCELHETIAELRHDLFIEKHLPSAFVDTCLHAYLQDHHITTVAIAGYVTQVCCDTTARYAFHLGYEVEFIADATATLDMGTVPAKTLYESALATQAAAFSRVMSTEEWFNALGAS